MERKMENRMDLSLIHISFGMYLDGKWYRLKAGKALCSDDPVKGLDVSVLQDYLLEMCIRDRMLAGHVQGHKTSLSSMFEAVGSYTAGTMTEEEVKEYECKACPTCGSCSGMYTANSMNCLTAVSYTHLASSRMSVLTR